MEHDWRRWSPVGAVLAAGSFLAFVAPLVNPPPEGAEPIFTMAALWLFGFILLPITALLSALDKAPTVRWIIATFSGAVALLLTAGG